MVLDPRFYAEEPRVARAGVILHTQEATMARGALLWLLEVPHHSPLSLLALSHAYADRAA